jgi:hypothetical protein
LTRAMRNDVFKLGDERGGGTHRRRLATLFATRLL